MIIRVRSGDDKKAEVAHLVERQPSKLRVAGSSPVFRSMANVAQSVEHIHGKDEVTSSILVIGSFNMHKLKHYI